MRDHGWRAPECADETMRDALPLHAHGRLSTPERRALEAHLAACAACTAELTLLGDARLALTAPVPALDMARIAAGVIAATRQPAAAPTPAPADVIPIASARAARPAWASRWAGRGGLRAAAALLIVAIGASTVVTRLGGPDDVATDAPAATTALPALASAPMVDSALDGSPTLAQRAPATAAQRARGGHVLGDGFEDLDDRELSAVLDAIEHDGASLPALEPVVFAPDYVGGGG